MHRAIRSGSFAGLTLSLISLASLAACTDEGEADDGVGAATSLDGGSGAGGSTQGGSEAGGAPPEGGGGGEGGAAGLTIPTYFRLLGSAEGSENGTNVTCSLDFIFELDPPSEDGGVVSTEGVHGGDAGRVILDDEGAGFAFSASSYGMVVATLDSTTGALELVIPVNETAENHFWKELALLPGTMGEDGNSTGTWTCAPLDIEQEGYTDTTVTVEGTWHAEPLEQQ